MLSAPLTLILAKMLHAISLHHHLAHQCCMAPLRSNGHSNNDIVAITTVCVYQRRLANGAHRYMRNLLIFKSFGFYLRNSSSRTDASVFSSRYLTMIGV